MKDRPTDHLGQRESKCCRKESDQEGPHDVRLSLVHGSRPVGGGSRLSDLPESGHDGCMTDNDDAWTGTVVKKSRGLMDGSNLYRRLHVRLEGGDVTKVKVDKDLWEELEVGDPLVKRAGSDPQRP